MLVCSVSLRSQRHTITAGVVEVAEALDDPATALLFGTLVDSPGNARDILDGFVGQQVKEAAVAADSVTVAIAYKISILENTAANSAVQLVASTGAVAASIAEAASAAATQDATATVAARVAVLDGTFVNPQAPATVVSADVPDSGPITVLN